MSDLDHARALLEMALADINALRGMLQVDNESSTFFSDEIFGFHAQQAAEKTLKARIASLGGFYPKTHDLMVLLTTLTSLGHDVSGIESIVDLNSFAVQYRYESVEEDEEELDRAAVFIQIEDLYSQMESLIG